MTSDRNSCSAAVKTNGVGGFSKVDLYRSLPDRGRLSRRGMLRSERTERSDLDDRDYAPTNTAGDVALDMTAWMHELVGGKFTLAVQATNAPAANTAFSVRGKNPRDGAAMDRLVSDVDEEFRSFAWRIAMHETGRWSRRGTYLFNLFNPISGRRGSLKEVPNWGEPDGWGIGQIDRSGNRPGSRDVFTREVYNWKTNIVSMNTVLRAKRQDADGGVCSTEPILQGDSVPFLEDR